MISSNYQDAINRCQQGDDSAVQELVNALSDQKYIEQLDDRSVYENASVPPNLKSLLECLVQRADLGWITNKVVALADIPTYDPKTDEGSAKRAALTYAVGASAKVTPELIHFLDNSLIDNDENYQEYALKSLAKIGTKESVQLIWDRIFNPKSTVVAADLQNIYFPSYTAMLGVHRDKIPVISFLLSTLYQTSVRHMVLRCVIDDVIQLVPDPEFDFHLAKLNEQTTDSIKLATVLAKWTINTASDHPLPDIQVIAKRITDLLGIRYFELTKNDTQSVKAWAVQAFNKAKQMTKDGTRSSEIDNALVIIVS